MRTISFIIFFTIFFLIYGLINYYIFIRGWQCLPAESRWRTPYLIVFLVLALSFIAGRFMERVCLCIVSDIFVWIGSFWLAAMLYFLFIIVLVDLVRLINFWLPFLPSLIKNMARAKQITLIASVTGVLALLVLGLLNALHPRIKTIELVIPKQANFKGLNIVAASDIHLGTIIGRKRFCTIVNIINSLQPDIVLFSGDIVDEDLGPVVKQNLGEALTKIQSRYGVYAITGNHEYIGGVDAASDYLGKHRVVMLRDSAALIANSVYIVGREDRSAHHFSGKGRKPLTELLAPVDKNLPIILMDHQPFQLSEAEANGVDLQISGHTHHGQLWPLNYITGAVYEVSMGYLKKGNTHYYVSCGVGTWGPPVRIGNSPEIVNVRLTFQ
ncbi:MAG: metallophosphoesterase [Candidatus Zhuqueibacterota bacterium]